MISLIIPICNEEDNLEKLLGEIKTVSRNVPIEEIITVDDGSSDNSFQILSALKHANPKIRVIRHERRSGQSAGLLTGIRAARFPVIATIDGDGQNNPADIEKLYEIMIQRNGIEKGILIAGEREKRHDDFIRRLSSRIANEIRSGFLKDKTRDTGCSLKMFRREDYLRLPYFNHMHRFIPALMMREGVEIFHVPVSHRPRIKGISKYGTLDRLSAGIIDLMGVLWLIKRAKPLIKIEEI